MTPSELTATYRRLIANGQLVNIRRFTASSGSPRPKVEKSVRASVSNYSPDDLIGNIQQGDLRVILMRADLEEGDVNLPILKTDKVVIANKSYAIEFIDDVTRQTQGVVVAIELGVRG